MNLSADLNDNDAPLFAGNIGDVLNRDAGLGGGGASTTMHNSDAISHAALNGQGSNQIDFND